MPLNRNNDANWTERIVGALCYATGGLAGIVYIIISRSSTQTPFFRFHFLQSIVLGIISVLLNWSCRALGTIAPAITAIPGVETGLNIGLMVYALLPLYGLIFCLLGKRAEIPWLSYVVRNQMR